MNKILFIALIVQTAFAVDLNEFHSQKLSREWSVVSESEVKYQKVVDWSTLSQSGRSDQFYEGVFNTRIDHFRPLDQRRVDFVCIV